MARAWPWATDSEETAGITRGMPIIPMMAQPRSASQLDPTPQVRRVRGQLDGRKVTVRFLGVATRVPRYMKLGWLLLREPRIPTRGKAALAGALGYAISPIDPLPGFIPIIGQLDDLAILLLGLRSALASAPPVVADEHLAATGVTFETLDRDLTTVRATAVWLAERGGALAARAAKAAFGGALDRLSQALSDARASRVADADADSPGKPLELPAPARRTPPGRVP